MGTGKHFMYESIYQDLLDGIRSGAWPPGSRLPSEKELSEQYGVSRITSKKALEMLANQGRISRTPGRGSFVLEGEQAIPDVRANGSADVLPVKMIGVILDSFGADFGAVLLKSIERECAKRGADLLLKCTYGNVESENRAIESLLKLGVRGLMIMCAQGESYNTSILKLAIDRFPVTLIDRRMEGIPIPCIETDNRSASGDLTRLLIRRGHKRICFVTHRSTGTSSIRERYNGFVDEIVGYEGVEGCTLEVPGYDPAPRDQYGRRLGFDREQFRSLLTQREEYTGFLCIEEDLCSILCRELDALGKPGEIVSFDGMGKSGADRVVACARQDEEQMGALAVATLDRIIQGEKNVGGCFVPYRIVTGKEIFD